MPTRPYKIAVKELVYEMLTDDERANLPRILIAAMKRLLAAPTFDLFDPNDELSREYFATFKVPHTGRTEHGWVSLKPRLPIELYREFAASVVNYGYRNCCAGMTKALLDHLRRTGRPFIDPFSHQLCRRRAGEIKRLRLQFDRGCERIDAKYPSIQWLFAQSA